MSRLVVIAVVLASACGDSPSGAVDAGGDPLGDGGGDDPTGDGGTTGTRTIELTLANRPTNAGMFSFFVAYQDGSAAWKTAPAPAGDTYTFSVSAPSYGVAFGCIGNVVGQTTTQLRAVTTAHFAVGERTKLAFEVPARCTDHQPMTVPLTGSVSNRPFSGVLFVQFGTRQAIVNSQSGSFTLQSPPGTRDLIVAHAVPRGNGDYFVDEAVVVRDLAVTGPTMRNINFNQARSTAHHDVVVNVQNPSARVLAATTLYTANGTAVVLTRASSDWESDSLAAMQARATDVYDQSISVSTFGQGVTITNATSVPGVQTFVAPAPLGSVTPMVVGKTPYPILMTTWPAYTSSVGYGWTALQQLSAQQCGGGPPCAIAWTAYLSPGVTGTTPGYVMPDLADVVGWKQAYALVAGAQVLGSVTAQTSTAGASDFPPAIPEDGTKRAFVRSDFGLTP